MKAINWLMPLVFLAASPAYAANARCENCDQTGFENVAKSLGPGDHLVFSVSQRLALAFTSECDANTPGFDPGVATMCVFPRPLNADENAQFTLVQRIASETGGSMKYERVVPIRDIPPINGVSLGNLTSHEYARRPGDWHRLSQGVVQYARTFFGTFNGAQFWQSAGSVVGLAGTQVEITIEFPDGGKVTFKVDYGDQTMGQQVGPIRDADGNLIPTPSDSPSIMSGYYTFSSNGQNAMNVHLSALGWATRFPEGTPSCPNIGRLIYECGWTGSDMRAVSCKLLTRC